MGQKITGVRIDIGPRGVDVRALSRNRRGAQFTLRALPRFSGGRSREQLKAAVTQGLADLLPERSKASVR